MQKYSLALSFVIRNIMSCIVLNKYRILICTTNYDLPTKPTHFGISNYYSIFSPNEHFLQHFIVYTAERFLTVGNLFQQWVEIDLLPPLHILVCENTGFFRNKNVLLRHHLKSDTSPCIEFIFFVHFLLYLCSCNRQFKCTSQCSIVTDNTNTFSWSTKCQTTHMTSF